MTNIASMITEIGDKFHAATSDLSGRLSELERRAARSSDDHEYVASGSRSIGEIVASAENVQELTSNFRGKTTVKITGEEVASITSAPSTVGATGSTSTSLVPAHRVDGIVSPHERQIRVRDLINQARTTSNSIEWPRETGFTNNAAPVAETTQKPYSDLTFDLQNTPVRTIAHMFKASRQILDDAPALIAYINRRGTYGLQFVEEQQLLNGDGTGQNLNGIIPQAAAFAPQFSSASETPIDRLLQAISQAEDSEIPVNGIVLNKRDWRVITGTKDGDGRYIAGDSPFGIQAPRLWGLDVATTNAIPAGTFLTGAFQDGAQIFDRMDVEVMISSENADDFEKNMISIRIEARLAFATYRPDAFITGDLYPTP
ncbi:phage major capsid protein [Nitratireductor aquimarinus]|uniref:phage major capsid protein n=1 Tax=Nitratireductor aquimarinus TaxID=889300 RepID=UPI001A8C3507|nr:phage major capsid protein [Nitratireductor aquimarinus]MBN8242937.1 phage major capsid protein [Nitratireductor aquimarinus]MBY6132038.1 phage major capsid protein [Nitratireductor aquimarinus]MCA1301574.1 phage major capsid protein [Nitratireductor aquimarinus]